MSNIPIASSDDMDIVHAISRSSLLKITVFDKERHPLPNDSWDQRPQLIATKSSVENLEKDLSAMRDTLNGLLSNLNDKRKQDEQSGINETGESGKPAYKHLSTTDMAEFLEESQAKRKDSLKSPSDAMSARKPSPTPQSQSAYSYPQPVVSTATKSTTNTNNYQYYSPSPYQQEQQTPFAQSYAQPQPQSQSQQQPQPQTQQHQQPQQHGTVKPPSQPGYPTAPVYRQQSYNNPASAPPQSHYGQPPHQMQTAPGVEPSYQQGGPPPTQTHSQNQPSTPTYSQQQAHPRPPYAYSDNARWR
ncbi:unnamed protein product [Umbelopsis vinacea]